METINHECYGSLEVAKLLKEEGFDWPRDTTTPKIHPTQKPVPLLKRLIEIFTDPGDVVIDPTAGSGSSLLAAANLNRRAYGFEIKKDFFRLAQKKIMPLTKVRQTNIFDDI